MSPPSSTEKTSSRQGSGRFSPYLRSPLPSTSHRSPSAAPSRYGSVGVEPPIPQAGCTSLRSARQGEYFTHVPEYLHAKIPKGYTATDGADPIFTGVFTSSSAIELIFTPRDELTPSSRPCSRRSRGRVHGRGLPYYSSTTGNAAFVLAVQENSPSPFNAADHATPGVPTRKFGGGQYGNASICRKWQQSVIP